jgi:tetratricopeptide (TPR) repeat protein
LINSLIQTEVKADSDILEKNRMRKNLGFYATAILVVIWLTGCNKELFPSGTITKNGNEYDTVNAEFNYTYVEAIRQKLLGNYGDALKYFEQCIRLVPGSDASYFQMAQIISESGDLKHAKEYALKAFSLDNKNLWYLMTVGSICYQQKNIDSAIIYYEKASELFPYKPEVIGTLGNLYTENKQYSKATSIYELCEKHGTMSEAMTISMVKNLLEEKKYDEALSQAKLLALKNPDEMSYNALLAEVYRSKGDYKSAKEVFQGIIDSHPDDPQAQLALVDFLLNEKKYEEFFSIVNSISLNNKISAQDKIALFSKVIDDPGVISEESEKLTMALLVLEANYKEDMIVPLLRTEFLIKSGKLKEAGIRLEEIIGLFPENYYAWEKLLLVYLQIPDYKRLMARGEECATKFNRSYFAKVLYANGALENGQYQLALDELKKAEILAGENKDQVLQIATMRADIYYRMKDYTKAFEYFEEAIKTDKDDLTVLNNYAYYLAEQNLRLKDAEVMAKKVIQMDGNNTTFLDTYAWVLYKRGKVREAAKIMENIIGSGGKPDSEWYEHYGYILKRQKKCEKAVENWTIALKLDEKKAYLVKEIENCKK